MNAYVNGTRTRTSVYLLVTFYVIPKFWENGKNDVWGQISRKLHYRFLPNVVCKTTKIPSNNLESSSLPLVTLYISS